MTEAMTEATTEATARTYGWRSWQEAAREALIGAAAGIVLSFIESGGTKELPDSHTFFRNVIIFALVILVSRGLETALSWAIEQSNIPTIFRTIVYAAGGWIGYILGVVISSGFVPEADDFGEGEYHFVYSLAGCAIGAITTGLVLHHNRKRNDRLRASIERLKEHEFAEKELEIARSMQERLMPPALIERDGFRVTARTHAAHLVGGDFFDVLRLADGSEAILAADVAGKGIAAALIMATCKAMVPFLASSGGAADVMTALNARLCEQLQRREFVAMVFVRFEPSTGVAEIVNAGMPDPLILGPNGTARAIAFNGDRLPLGAMRGSRYEATTMTLARGERMLLFSDGLPEASAGGAPLGYERVEELATRAASVESLIDDVRAIATVDDDLTVVAIELV